MKKYSFLQALTPKSAPHGVVLSLFVVFSVVFSTHLDAKSKSKCPAMGPKLTVQEYCDLYAGEARRQMKKYGVPASITLAQGILESGYGSSYLAIEANNHFGIKAYSRDWKGKVVYCDDDARNEPFCKFSSVLEGYEYHSTFLRTNSRYAPLFKLNVRDYESWANGLKTCGYATNPKYGQLLINMIESNHLDAYDVANEKILRTRHPLYVTREKRGLKYVKCVEGDDLAAIAKEYGIWESRLRKWNELTKDAKLKQGDIIYLQKKHKKADAGYEVHTVRAGESMWSISQTYGVTIKSLMKRNKLVSATVHTGQVLKLR